VAAPGKKLVHVVGRDADAPVSLTESRTLRLRRSNSTVMCLAPLFSTSDLVVH
jgi:hypothetical protein